MKRILLLISFVTISLFSSAQKYQDALLYGENKNRLDIFYLLGIPNDTFAIPSFPQDKRRKPHLAAKGNTMYLWDTVAYKWNALVGGGGSTDTTSLSNRINLKLNISDTAGMLTPYTRVQRFLDSLLAHTGRFNGVTSSLATKLNISDTISKTWDWGDITGKPSLIVAADTANKWITAVRRSNDSVYYQKGGTWTFAYKDSVGSGGGGGFTTDSLKYNSSNSTITLYQTGASDLSAFINSSYLLFDSTYSPMGGSVNDSTAKVKSARIQLNGSTVSPTATDTTLSWNIQALVAADTINKYVTAIYRKTASDSVFYVKGGTHTFAYKDSIGGGGGAPSGNFGNGVIIRNGALVVPGGDSLDFDAGLYIKGVLSATALPTGGVDADSIVVINSSGAFKKRNVSAFARMNTTSAAGQLALFNGVGTLYSSSKFNFSDASYPSMSIIGSDPLIYIGPSATLTNNPSFGSGAGAAIYGGATYKSVQLVDQISGGIQMARFYNSSGTIYNTLNGLIISNTLSSPSNYQGSFAIQRTVPYAVTGLNYHGFTDQTDFRVGTNSFNSFGSFVTIGNNRTSQGHFAAFQSVWYKDSTNRMQAIYDFVSAVSEARAGTIDSLYRFKVFEATNTGATIVRQYGIQIDNLTAATTNVGAWIYNNVGIGPTAHTPSERLTVDGNILGTGTIQTGNPGISAGAWKLGAYQSAAVALETGGYIEVSIGGTVYRLATVNIL